ncbi:hypothetical protein F5Y12DRAFT_761047 [Xylaria sp. FL1777]|nr:hypothetical protein F5Y12DRAFT_761047 [Xylaria sp. FL1777]
MYLLISLGITILLYVFHTSCRQAITQNSQSQCLSARPPAPQFREVPTSASALVDMESTINRLPAGSAFFVHYHY